MARRNMTVLGVVVLAAVLLFGATPARAHHSFAAEFDANDANGKVEKWSFEASTPTSLIRSGVKPGFIKAGDQVTIKGFHARDASQNVGAGRELVTADGRAFAIG